MKVEFIETDTGAELGYAAIVDGEVDADNYGRVMLSAFRMRGKSPQEAVRAYATGWSNGWIHTQVTE